MIMNDIFCTFIRLNQNTYECVKCGLVLQVSDSIDQPPIFPCRSPLINFESQKLQDTFSKHIDQAELCSTAEIETRHNICSSCEFFKNNTCDKCGCLLNKDKIYMNKLAIKTQSCPIGKW